jgi:hypothetical protein
MSSYHEVPAFFFAHMLFLQSSDHLCPYITKIQTNRTREKSSLAIQHTEGGGGGGGAILSLQFKVGAAEWKQAKLN